MTCPDCGRPTVRIVIFGQVVTGSLRCWDCTRARQQAIVELITRHRDEYDLILACLLARTTPHGEPIQ